MSMIQWTAQPAHLMPSIQPLVKTVTKNKQAHLSTSGSHIQTIAAESQESSIVPLSEE